MGENSSNSDQEEIRKMTNLNGAEKLKMEQEFVERELGTLYEFTLKLEDELNSAIVSN